MFKILVLQALYNLSDDQTEYQIRDRLSFMRFLGLDLHQRIPDAKTIWLFRETLAQAGVVDTLFAQFDTYLAGQGLQARGGQLIDASLIPVPTQRNSREENATIKAGACPADWEAQSAKRRQKDTEARWIVKRGVSHYGYKNHVNIDKQHKLIRRYTVTDAAYRSEEIETQLKKRKLRSRIQYKGYRDKPLPPKQTHTNQRRARVRARVEHGFGHQVTAMGGKLIRTIGRVQARAKIGLKNLTYNFQRFLVLTTVVRWQPASS
jgi:IS5 family transposase